MVSCRDHQLASLPWRASMHGLLPPLVPPPLAWQGCGQARVRGQSDHCHHPDGEGVSAGTNESEGRQTLHRKVELGAVTRL